MINTLTDELPIHLEMRRRDGDQKLHGWSRHLSMTRGLTIAPAKTDAAEGGSRQAHHHPEPP